MNAADLQMQGDFLLVLPNPEPGHPLGYRGTDPDQCRLGQGTVVSAGPDASQAADAVVLFWETSGKIDTDDQGTLLVVCGEDVVAVVASPDSAAAVTSRAGHATPHHAAPKKKETVAT